MISTTVVKMAHPVLSQSESRIGDGMRRSNNRFDQWENGKLSTGSGVQSFPRGFLFSFDVALCFLYLPNTQHVGCHMSGIESRMSHVGYRISDGT